MSDRTGFISRAQLIKSTLATSLLAACGGKVTPTTPAPAPTPTPFSASCASFSTSSADRFGLDHVLAHDPFKAFDKQALLDAFDFSPHIAALQQGYSKQAFRRVLQGTVITRIPSSGIVITTPGTYTFGGDLSWSPSATSTAAITIQCSNVTLDCGGYTLTASVSDSSWQTTGILVSGPLENVTIKNGTLASLTEYGIQANRVCGLNVVGVIITGLCMNNTKIHLATPAGIFVGLSLNVAISNCIVTKTNVTTDSSAGIQLISVNGAMVSNCAAISLVNNDGSMQGYSYLGCGYVTTSGCTADSFQTHFVNNITTPGHTCIGFLPTLCQNLSFVNCSATGMTGCCDDCHGMSVFLCWSSTVQGFRASHILDGVNNVSTHSQSGAKATGLEVYSFGNIQVSNCAVSDVRAINPEDLQAAGFSAWGSLIGFKNCSATNVSVQNDYNVADMRGVGFGWAPDPRAGQDGINFSDTPAVLISYTDCRADRCDVAFDTWDHIDSTWTGTTYTNCPVGYLAEPGAQRTLTCDPCSECTTPLITKLTNLASGNTYPH